MSKYYFAVKDGTVNAETGEKGEAGMVVKTTDAMTADDMIRMLEYKLPCYKGRIREIAKEEYEREYGEEE